MKLPLSLIKSFIPLNLPPAKIGETLTLLGLEIDRIENAEPSFAKVIVAEVRSAQKHPDAKQLQIATVFDGKSEHTVVCAAANCRAGLRTAFAPDGAILTDRDGKQRRIEKATVRGVLSHGMLCSAGELHLSEESQEIMELPEEFSPGQDLAQLLWDPVFEISLTPNLGHCMSALGVARELSAALQIPLHKFNPVSFPSHSPMALSAIDGTLCPRYTCALVEGVEKGASPFWLQNQLRACGQKSINLIVDAANWVMMKWGQPLHAFDADRLEGGRIEVRAAEKPLIFLGLDGVEREVPKGTLLIWDAKKPVAIAGVMGGANSSVTESTKRILLEAAVFDPISIRNTSKALGLRTESSQRFEKGVDPSGLERALFETAALLKGAVKGFAGTQKEKAPKMVPYRPERINHILGTRLSETEIEEILGRLEIQLQNGKAQIPSYRNDLNEEIDLSEEVARIYGYNHIEKSLPRCTLSPLQNDPLFDFVEGTKRRLAALGLMECLSCDLISSKLADISREITPPSMQFLKTVYSKSEEFSVLRTSLLPGLLQTVQGNFAQKNRDLSLFEVGRIHFLQEGRAVECPMAAILLTGKRSPHHWGQKSPDTDFFDLKGMLEGLLSASFKASNHLSMHPGRQADLFAGSLILGSLGEVHPALLKKFDIDQRVYYAELNLQNLFEVRKTHFKIAPLPLFPASERDWTVPLDLALPIERIFENIHSVRSPLLESVELLDLYRPEGAEKKNATFRFVYRDLLKTISLEEVEAEHKKILETVAKLLAK